MLHQRELCHLTKVFSSPHLFSSFWAIYEHLQSALFVTDTQYFTCSSHLMFFWQHTVFTLWYPFANFRSYLSRQKCCECLSGACTFILDNTCYSSEFGGDIMVGFTVKIEQCFMWDRRKGLNNSIMVTVLAFYI